MKLQYDDLAKHLKNPRVQGEEYESLCPFHDDSSPSFYLNRRTGLWICHACHVKGNSVQFRKLLDLEEEDRGESLEHLKIKLKETKHHWIRTEFSDEEEGMRVLPESWLIQFDAEYDKFWQRRRVSEEIHKKFRLGTDGIYWATMPLRDISGNLLGVSRRSLMPKHRPKYTEPAGYKKSQHLFGASHVDSDTLVICEGPIDALRLWSFGVQAVALQGTNFSREHERLVRMLNPRRVVLFLDSDPAGRDGTLDVAEALRGIPVMSVSYSKWDEGNDPGSMSDQQLERKLSSLVPVRTTIRGILKRQGRG